MAAAVQRRAGDWDCPKCGHMIFRGKSACFKCNYTKPGSREADTRAREDWDCPECGYEVFASKKECPECGKWRPKQSPVTVRDTAASESAAAAPTSYQRRDGDWDCKACGYKDNFARRPTCFKCEKPKGWEPSEEDRGECKVCMDASVETRLKTCTHASMCEACSKNDAVTECPFCRAPFAKTDVEKIILC